MDLMDLISSDANIQPRLFDLSPSSFIRGKFSDVKYIFQEAKLLFTNFYSSRKAQKFWWLFIHPRFSKFFNWVPSQIWLSISSLKKRPAKCSTIVAERVLNVSGKLYTNVLHHTTRKNNIPMILSWRFPSLGHWSALFPFQRFSGPFLMIFQTQIRT